MPAGRGGGEAWGGGSDYDWQGHVLCMFQRGSCTRRRWPISLVASRWFTGTRSAPSARIWTSWTVMELAQIALEYSCTRRVEFYRAQGFYRVSKFQLAADLICSSWSWRGGLEKGIWELLRTTSCRDTHQMHKIKSDGFDGWIIDSLISWLLQWSL